MPGKGHLFDVPHGLANAIFLTHATKFNAETAPAKYDDIARRLGLKDSDALVEAIATLRSNLNIPSSLREAGVSEDVFNARIDEIAVAAVADPCTGTNPREINAEQMKALFVASFA